MMNQMVRHNTSSDDQPPAIEALLERLRTSHPDMSGWTVVSMTGRSRDFLHHQIHTRVGGLLPAVLSFDDYRTSRIAEATGGRAALPVEDALLRLHGLRCREEGRSLPPANTERLLSFLSTIAEFSVTREELRSLDRIGLEQIERIDGFFSLLDSFRSSLAGEGLFYPPFEAGRFAGLKPAANDLFFGLPLMTPASQSFFRRIPRERLYVDAPFFGSAMPGEPPGYESALSLMRRLGLPERRVAGQGLAFSELSERAGLPALLAQEIDAFLRAPRSDGEQLFIVPLDERLSFYLWQLLFRPLGNRINFAPWLPFTHFAPAQRLAQAVRGKTGLMEVRRDLVAELTARWSDLDEADRSACEGAITLCDTLERLRPLMGREWAALSEYLISAKKLRLRGRRSAPIQVVGLGDVTGIPFGRAVIAPMNSGIFPSKSFSGPYLNLIHLSRLYRTQYEAEDLALRQFLAFGNTAHIVALYDQASGAAPSPHFSFLATEFGQTAVKRRLAPTPFTVPEGRLVIENTAELKEKLQRHIWSFTSLQKFFTCPCRFILEDIEKIHPPACFEEKEGAGLLIGNFLHRFFADLKDHPPAVEKWQERFDAAWEGDRDLMEKLPDQAARKAIVRSFLSDIAAWELETGRPLLFSDSVTGTELKLTASFGEGGRYQLQGRIDRLQSEGEGLLITDLKYKEKTEVSEKTRLFELVDKPDAFDDRFQLVIYAYLALKNKMVTPGNLGVAYVFLRPKVRGDYEGRLSEEDLAACDATLDKIAQRLDAFLSQESFLPNFHAAGCNYCFHKALCLKPDLYRTGGKPW